MTHLLRILLTSCSAIENKGIPKASQYLVLFCLEQAGFQNPTSILVWVYEKNFPFGLYHFQLYGKDLHKCLGTFYYKRGFYRMLRLWLQSQKLLQNT